LLSRHPLSVLARRLEIVWNAVVIGKMHVQCTTLWGAMQAHKPMIQRLEPPCSSIRSAPPSTQMPSTRLCQLYAPAACISPALVKDMHTYAWRECGRLADSNPTLWLLVCLLLRGQLRPGVGCSQTTNIITPSRFHLRFFLEQASLSNFRAILSVFSFCSAKVPGALVSTH
jgi:hypothetical protein